jgi:hypothetical protein
MSNIEMGIGSEMYVVPDDFDEGYMGASNGFTGV